MIILTYINRTTIHVLPGDEFHMTVKDELETEVLIREVITVEKTINFIASYRFALEDGTCPGFHLCGIFGNTEELPQEIQMATYYQNLTDEQRKNFLASIGVKLFGGPHQLEA